MRRLGQANKSETSISDFLVRFELEVRFCVAQVVKVNDHSIENVLSSSTLLWCSSCTFSTSGSVKTVEHLTLNSCCTLRWK